MKRLLMNYVVSYYNNNKELIKDTVPARNADEAYSKVLYKEGVFKILSVYPMTRLS